MWRVACVLTGLAVATGIQADDQTGESTSGLPPQKSPPQLKMELFRGRVVLLREALKQRRIKSYDEFDRLVAVATDSGQLIPIIPDWRGRAFFQDRRLRDRRVELIGYRRPEVSMLQVQIVYTFDEKGVRQFTDYWCDQCSIAMFEVKPCDCCQEEIRLRFQARELPKSFRTKPDAGPTGEAAATAQPKAESDVPKSK